MIEVPEHGEVTCALGPLDVQHIEAVASGTAGIVFPEPPKRKNALVKVGYSKEGKATINAGGVVGIIPLPSGEVLHIAPKVGSSHGVFWLLCHALGFDDIKLLSRLSEIETREDPLEWLFVILRHEVRKLVQAGLRKDYVPVEETAGIVRGRILPARTIAETRGLAHQVTCLYDDFTADIFDNQVLRLALRAAARYAPNVRHDLLGTDALFDGEVTHERSDLRRAADDLKRLLDQQHPGRKRYVPAHTLAYMVLRLLSAGGDGQSWRQPGILLDMPRLFEAALRNVLRPLGPSTFGHQFELACQPANKGSLRLQMNPDIPLAGLIVDAKYKRHPLRGRKGEAVGELPISGDLYQAYTYSSFDWRPCALVYAVGTETVTATQYALGFGATQAVKPSRPRVGMFSLDLSGNFDALETRCKQLIDQLEEFVKQGAA